MSNELFIAVFAVLTALYVVAVAVDTVADALGSLIPGHRSTKENAVLLVVLYVAWRRWQARRGEAP